MRVELLYSPGCNTYKSVRNTLETVIAEEALPIPVEMVEHSEPTEDNPRIRIDGNEVHNSAAAQTLDQLRDLLCGKWKELTSSALHRA
jgi:hypothetical protein